VWVPAETLPRRNRPSRRTGTLEGGPTDDLTGDGAAGVEIDPVIYIYIYIYIYVYIYIYREREREKERERELYILYVDIDDTRRLTT